MEGEGRREEGERERGREGERERRGERKERGKYMYKYKSAVVSASVHV